MGIRRLSIHFSSAVRCFGAKSPFPKSAQEKPLVVVVGTGWAGARLVRDLNPRLCNVVVFSQRNHMLFTPLLPQTCTGTLEFRSICEPILRVQPALAHVPNGFFLTYVYDVCFEKRFVNCIAVGSMHHTADHQVAVHSCEFPYDSLVLAHGARPNTFNILGVEENAFFLREVSEARGIRKRIVQNLMIAKLPTTSEVEVRRLLHVVVVGGGPTGVEFAADLVDFLQTDIPSIDPQLLPFFRVTLVEANEVLGTFDRHLRRYGAARLQKVGVCLRKAVVAEVTPSEVILTDGEVLSTGLVVWSTGVGASPLSRELDLDKNAQGRISVNDHFEVLRRGCVVPDAFAIGDCAAHVETPLPTLAAVASRQGKHLAKDLNRRFQGLGRGPPFVYKHLGSMASLGQEALIELKSPSAVDLTGWKALFLWRSAYFTMLGSIRSRLYVVVNWVGSTLFGRDITYIAEMTESKVWSAVAKGASREQAKRRLRIPKESSSSSAVKS